ncbi:biotin carboxylase N-terminal domain-containing protein [Microbacterium sp. VKM Ac-2923]|uniref:acetyl/propionyl/methylcrotonyl-CoA carboxylase subunit alpha n=1 Tax=Microbacterium sp. VKM Ac-2923 TaxID=2929476 RepID=UPI001FB4A2F5|nr:biotin carboxylase N-terminal domain-containing protein [Microbacterium sp. VKM Ac-2923]MCJ1707257.1 acetyl/propionyl-CoA carboxylase subunit alpha [Microbacterium sp. VKM Ac-2923]
MSGAPAPAAVPVPVPAAVLKPASAPRRGRRPFDAVLVANRGEIARRVFRTLRRLGIRSVAVYTDADAGAVHAREADRAVRVPSYLDVDAVVAAAVSSGADAVHPGYGFLSENAGFARACAAAGIVFVGPGVEALEVMGDKIRAKQHVAAHGVPTVPGFSAVGLSDAEIAARAGQTGYPLLVKPSAGGGGKGMTIATGPDDLVDALATARRVAVAAFGDDTLLLERLLERPRHIEVQVLADAHGTTLSLGERECTLQRRHQKVIEEAPSSVVEAETRARLGAAAVAAARSVGYLGAGTVEFLVAGDRLDEPFFIEMNTRLQVEHPVTELVTGVDLVEQQLRTAAGLALDLPEIHLDGHAIEARVYAETPSRGYLPAIGTVTHWHPGAARVDSAVETGGVITAHYDPLIAKVIAHGPDRETALARLDAALADTVVLGVDTNIADLRALLADPAVRAGDLDTGLLDRRGTPEVPEPSATALAAVAARAGRIADAETPTGGSVWGRVGAWRAGGAVPARTVHLEDDAGRGHTVPLPEGDEPPRVVVADGEPGEYWVHADGLAHRLRLLSRREAAARRRASAGRVPGAVDPDLVAPLPGTVVAVHAVEGEVVEAGARLVTIEAMKMEHTVIAPHAGTVRLRVAAGAQVARDAVVATVTPRPADRQAGIPERDAQLPEPESDGSEPESEVSQPESDVREPESEVPVPESEVPVPESEVPVPESEVPERVEGTGTPTLAEPGDPAGVPASIPSHKETLP